MSASPPVKSCDSPSPSGTLTTPSSLPRFPPLTPLGVCKGIVCITALTLTSLMGSVFMLGPILPLMAIRPQLFRWFADGMMNVWLLLPVALMEMVFGVTFDISGDKLQPDEGSIIIMNHRTRLDWMFFWVALHRQSTLRTEKILLKNDVKFMPGYGWAMQVACYIFLKRRWETDKPWLESLLQYYKLLNYKAQYLIFPEGTNFDANTKRSSDRFAEKNNLPLYHYCLHPRTTGLVFLVEELRRKQLLDTVYDVTVTYPDTIPEHGELNLTLGSLPSKVNFHIRKLPQTNLPNGKQDLESWCLERWREKEEILKTFYTGSRDSQTVGSNGQGDGAKADCQGDRSDRRTLLAVLVYWSVFMIFSFYVLSVSTIARCFFLVTSIFYTYQYVFRGGVESIIMETCRRYFGQRERIL